MSKSIRTSRIRLFAASGIAVLALAVTACGPTDSDASGAQDQPSTPPATSQPGSQQPAGQPAAQQPAPTGALIAAKTPSFAAMVTDDQGRTLYRFDKDTAHPSASNCSGDCAVKWPPALAKDSVTVTGIDKSLVSTVTRADGSKQLTLGGWPLYRFAKDTKAGDTLGQGVGGTWFVSSPQGKKAASSAGTSTGGDTSGY